MEITEKHTVKSDVSLFVFRIDEVMIA